MITDVAQLSLVNDKTANWQHHEKGQPPLDSIIYELKEPLFLGLKFSAFGAVRFLPETGLPFFQAGDIYLSFSRPTSMLASGCAIRDRQV